MQKCEPRKPELSENDAQIVASGCQDRVHRIAGTTEQVVTAHQTVVFRMSDDRFDGIAAFERAAQCSGDAALLSRDVHAHVFDAVTAVAAIDEAAFGLDSGEFLNLV